MVKLASHLEEEIEKLEGKFGGHLKEWKEKNTKDNHADILDHVKKAHDFGYDALKIEFESLADHKTNALAKRGEEISDGHLNDLLTAYISGFLEKSNGEHGKNTVEYHKAAVKDLKDHEKLDKLTDLYKLAFGDQAGNAVFQNMAAILKANQNRTYTDVDDPELRKIIHKHGKDVHIGNIYNSTIGKKEYQRNNKLAKIMLDDLSKGRYEIHSEKDGHSKFEGKDIGDLKDLVLDMHHGQFNEDDKFLKKEYGLKVKESIYKGTGI